jgi:Ca2+-binding RTX toxin-like protein
LVCHSTPAINIARGRSEGIPSLNNARRQIFAATRNSALTPYANWFEFGLNLKHRESLVNFIAAYGKGANAGALNTATTLADKRTAATALQANNLFMFEPAATSGLDDVDFWVGGLAERQAAFGGLLGSTFNYVFELQLENLQNGDRFYYLQRTDGLSFRFQLESNSLAELAMRNTSMQGGMQNVFETADFNFNMANLTGTTPVDLSLIDPNCTGCQLLTTADGTKLFFDPLHRGKNVEFDGTSGDDRMSGDIGDDTIYGNAGNDRIEGNDGNDTLVGGDGDDVMFGGNGDDVLKGGPGNDALSSGPGFGADILMGGDGNDFLLGGDDGVEHFGGGGDDVIVDGAMRAEGIFGGDGDDWIEAGDGHDGGIFGDGGNVFDLTAGLSAVGGDDVLEGGPGQDNHFGEGGDDIMRMSEGSNKFFGDFGFDWITLYGWTVPENIQLFLLALPNAQS